MGWSEGDTDSSVPERFSRQVERTPEKAAVSGERGALSYRDLDRLSDRYARALPELEECADARGARAALLLDHGVPVIAAALAALKAGFAVITLNPGDPPARFSDVREAVRPAVLITDEAHLPQAGAAGFGEAETVVLSRVPENGAGPGQLRTPSPDDLAFLVSTSGSTGHPKIITWTHRGTLHRTLRISNGLSVVPEDRIASLASFGVVAGLAVGWAALLNGATLCPYAIADRGMVGLGRWMAEQGVTVFQPSPSLLRSFASVLGREQLPGIRIVGLGSEPALRSDFDIVRRHFPNAALATGFGASETGVVTGVVIGSDEDPPPGSLTVGGALEGFEVRLLDEDGREVPDGEPGEIVVESRYLSAGYWGDPQLTAERFEGDGPTRRYRTGDVARRAPSGQLTIIGRSDFQVKIRGYRLQLEEVEGALGAQPGIATAAVAAHTTPRAETRLTGYLVAAEGARADVAGLRSSLAAVLPAHAIPASLVYVDALPLTPSGKVDRARLRELDADRGEAVPAEDVGGEAPASEPRPSLDSLEMLELREVRRRLRRIWEEVLEKRPVGDAEDFFALGGDSLRAMHMLVAIEQQFSCSLTPGVLLNAPTIQRLATVVYRSGPRTLPESEKALGERAGRLPVFMAYPLGGHGLRYRPLAQALGSEFPLHVLESPWWDGRPTSIRTAVALAAHHVREIKRHQPAGPYLLAGYSGGGMIALEVAGQLRAAGDEVALLAVIDTYLDFKPGSEVSLRKLARRASGPEHQLRVSSLEAARWSAMTLGKRAIARPRRLRWSLDQRRLGVVPERRRASYVQHLVSAALRGYRPAPYAGRVALFRCTDDAWPSPDRGWGSVVTGELEIHDIAADHYNVLQPPRVEELGVALAALMREALQAA
jgi:amino acid adenylation domain-containing protein